MMWQLHSAKSAAISFLPSSVERRLRKVKRKIMPQPLHISEVSACGGGLEQVFLLRQAGLDIRGRDLLEVGTGWAPVIPLILRLAGARHIYLTDAYELLDLRGLNASIAFLRERIGNLALRLKLTEAEVEQKLSVPPTEDLRSALSSLGMSYHVPFDYYNTVIKVDAIFSHSVLEHVPLPVIKNLLEGARQILRPGGMISHQIDNSDHREHGDSRLCRVDFLRYPDRVWSYFCLHPQDFTNRLRHSDYTRMIEEAGFVIAYERSFIDEKSRAAISHIPLASRFRGYKLDDLATIHSNIIAVLPSSLKVRR